MRTLRQRLHTPGLLVLGIDEAPSFLHNFSVPGDEDAEIELSWTDDEGQIFEEAYELDAETPEVRVFRLEEIK